MSATAKILRPAAARVVLVLAALMLIAAVLTADAHAAKKTTFIDTGIGGTKGTNNYVVSVGAEKRGGKFYVTISATHWAKGSASYTTLGKVTATRMRADFGAYGKVDLKLKKVGKKRIERYRECRSYGSIRATTQLFRATGTVKLRGEGGYTRVTKKFRNGQQLLEFDKTVQPQSVVNCLKDWDTNVPTVDEGMVELHAEGPVDTSVDPRGGSFAISAVRDTGIHAEYTDVGVNVFETSGNVDIIRYGWVGFLTANDFIFDHDLHNATLYGVERLTGTATYGRVGDDRTWTGDLAITLPGRAETPLTGPGIAVDLIPARSYFSTVPTFPPLAYPW